MMTGSHWLNKNKNITNKGENVVKSTDFKVRKLREPNAAKRYVVAKKDLPLHCPMDDMSLWNSHPKVYLPIEDKGEAICPYCGAHFMLKND